VLRRLATLAVLFVIGLGVSPSFGQQQQQQFDVCIGEYEGKCFSHTVWLPCGVDINAWAKQTCSSLLGGEGGFNSAQLQNKEGNRCGYAQYRIICK
jgi:hypothetical protein